MCSGTVSAPVTVRLPFPGFYNSALDSEIDSAIETFIADTAALFTFPAGAEYAFKDKLRSLVVMRGVVDYRALELDIAKEYAALFFDKLAQLTDLRIAYVFNGLSSPCEYNYGTDAAYVDISLADMRRIKALVPGEDLRFMAKKMFTSYDGYISTISADIDTWGPIEYWKPDQCLCLLNAVCVSRTFKWSDPDWYCYGLDVFGTVCDHTNKAAWSAAVDEAVSITGAVKRSQEEA